MKKILFMGDSITDSARSRENAHLSGSGYATLVWAELGYTRPGEFEFINRGIGGNCIVDLVARVKRDMINIAPDYMSILIGINDVWRELVDSNGVDERWFEIYYNHLIEQLTEALPNLKIMLLGPFVVHGDASDIYYDELRRGALQMEAAARRVAEKRGLIFIPLFDKFEAATKLAPDSFWSSDGIHPTPAGHEIIKRAWLEGFSKLEKE